MSITKFCVNNKGFAIGVILLCVALIAILAAGFAISSRGLPANIYTGACVSELVSQANLIRTKIGKCGVDYPEGDNGTSFHKTYPAGATETEVSALTCPGASAESNGLWTGIDGTFLPKTPTGFNSWKYFNDATSARIIIQTTSASSYGTCMEKTAAKFSNSEASVSGDTLTFTIIN